MSNKIIWSKIDEAPALATYSFLPVVQAFTKGTDVEIEEKDISLSGRIISTMSEFLTEEQRINDELAELGKLVQKEEANIIKLPNISASIPQLQGAIKELQEKGYKLPDYPENPTNTEEEAIKEKYSKCLGSAVNPVLREGNSDRRAAKVVKEFAQKHPHKLRAWAENSQTYVAHMNEGDFYANEQSIVSPKNQKVSMTLIKENGEKVLLKEIDALEGEILDATFMSVKALDKFLEEVLEDAKEKGILFSLHLKATMMKVSDPIMFGHAVKVYFKDVFEKYATEFNELAVNPNLGLGDLYKKLATLPADKKEEIEKAIANVYTKRAGMAMVDSDNGITNLHASNDIIIDASMPVVIRDGGKMWNAEGKTEECVATIPDRSFATLYKEIVEDCKRNGQFDVTTMGSVSNVGLMAQKAEDYGSHPTTFEISDNGVVEVTDENGTVLMSHKVEKGDIWRLVRAKDIPIKDWIRLAVERADITGEPAVFWLDSNRAHDANLIKKVFEYLPEFDKKGIEFHIMAPEQAMKFSLRRVRKGLNTISVTGNAIRDYLTDLFPILELGTSAKMLSIVPLLAGGGLFETGAGGSAPKHVQQFMESSHLRWDSLGEFLALAESLHFLARKFDNKKAEVVAKALDEANKGYLDNDKSPGRKVGQLDNKASHYYVAMYWAEALANQDEDSELRDRFASVAKELKENEDKIKEEFLAVEGKEADIGGYFKPNDELASKAMRPSQTFNSIIDSL